MEEKFCQSCSMPMGNTDDLYGTEIDGEKNTDYCSYCYENGQFTTSYSMEEMIDFCIPHMVTHNKEMSKEQAKDMMMQFFPKLKRWQQK